MNITIFPTGTGDAGSAVKYLLSDTDHEKKRRKVMPELLFGDPLTFPEIANATRRKHKYTSGVVAFRDNEHLSPEQINSVVDLFRSTFMPGLDADKHYADFWVAHRDKGNLELHFLVANTELTTGQQLNIHPPGQKNIDFFNAFVACVNDSLGFAQVVPDPLKISLKPFEAKAPTGKKDKKAKHDLAQVLHGEILEGFIGNRDQLIGFLKRSGMEVPRICQHFITVTLNGKNKRLRGPLFTHGADYSALVAAHHEAKTPKYLTRQESGTKQQQLAEGIAARTEFNQRRYLDRMKKQPKKLQQPAGEHSAPAGDSNKPVETKAQQKELSTLAPLFKQLQELKEQAVPSLPHQLARQQEEQEVATVLGAGVSVGGLEAQIGDLSLNYHTLLILLVSATGRRAAQIKSQLIAIEGRLAALSLELQNRKLEATNTKKLTI